MNEFCLIYLQVIQKNKLFVNLLLFPQNPREADAMTKVQAELDETKIILVSKMSSHEQLDSHND